MRIVLDNQYDPADEPQKLRWKISSRILKPALSYIAADARAIRAVFMIFNQRIHQLPFPGRPMPDDYEDRVAWESQWLKEAPPSSPGSGLPALRHVPTM